MTIRNTLINPKAPAGVNAGNSEDPQGLSFSAHLARSRHTR